ncbi:GM19333 [Drosophila sechellia]|uniref:GM19333 n=1 Tax=Drosophila sechellia TaxID=7238 RepID=B4IKV1_DROSE|nr:GM19333 [Drosophila sechellia]
MTNGTLLLYILAFPKVDEKLYRPVQLHPAIHEGKHLMLQHPNKAYAILGVCLYIRNTMVHQEKELEEDGGISPLSKGGHATCSYQKNNRQLIEAVDKGSLF